MTTALGELRIGDFIISAEEKDAGNVWIHVAAGPAAGEGGRFKASELLDAIEKFYSEQF